MEPGDIKKSEITMSKFDSRTIYWTLFFFNFFDSFSQLYGPTFRLWDLSQKFLLWRNIIWSFKTGNCNSYFGDFAQACFGIILPADIHVLVLKSYSVFKKKRIERSSFTLKKYISNILLS